MTDRGFVYMVASGEDDEIQLFARYDLIGYLRPDEQIEAVRVLGLARAYRRLGGFVDA